LFRTERVDVEIDFIGYSCRGIISKFCINPIITNIEFTFYNNKIIIPFNIKLICYLRNESGSFEDPIVLREVGWQQHGSYEIRTMSCSRKYSSSDRSLVQWAFVS